MDSGEHSAYSLGFHLSSGPLNGQERNLLYIHPAESTERKTRTVWTTVHNEFLCSPLFQGSKDICRVGYQLRRLTQASHISIEPISQCSIEKSTGQRNIVDPQSCFSHSWAMWYSESYFTSLGLRVSSFILRITMTMAWICSITRGNVRAWTWEHCANTVVFDTWWSPKEK